MLKRLKAYLRAENLTERYCNQTIASAIVCAAGLASMLIVACAYRIFGIDAADTTPFQVAMVIAIAGCASLAYVLIQMACLMIAEHLHERNGRSEYRW